MSNRIIHVILFSCCHIELEDNVTYFKSRINRFVCLPDVHLVTLNALSIIKWAHFTFNMKPVVYLPEGQNS